MYIYIYWYICNIYPSMKKRTRRLHFFCPFWFPIGGLTHWISSKTMLKQIQPIRVSRLQIAASSMKQCSASSCSRPPQKIWILWQRVWINGRAPQWFKWWKLTRSQVICKTSAIINISNISIYYMAYLPGPKTWAANCQDSLEDSKLSQFAIFY